MAKKIRKLAKSSESKTKQGESTQGKILIIDDEKSLRKSIKTILEKAGFYCETAYDFNSAKIAAENLNFDLILVDIILPDINGVKLIAKLQEQLELTAAIIFITGEPSLETASQAIRVGASDYLEKPTSKNDLLESIKRTLIHREHQISIKTKKGVRPITLNESFMTRENYSMPNDLKNEIQESVDNMHESLLNLKKKYGESFTEEQRDLLNQIAQNNGTLKKILKKLDS
ncbi:MAG: response regulator [Promethearchaeota archaeon]